MRNIVPFLFWESMTMLSAQFAWLIRVVGWISGHVPDHGRLLQRMIRTMAAIPRIIIAKHTANKTIPAGATTIS
jgi:hypothetical protein